MDWAMKYLLWHYREQMPEFFGKRGRSWHISVVITHSQEEGKCQAKCFVHLFHTCKQNSFAVMSVIEHILNTIKIEYPSISKTLCGQTTLVVIIVGPDPQSSVHRDKIWRNTITLRLFRPPSRKRDLRQENCLHESSHQEMGE